MNITEGNAVNVLLRYLLDEPDPRGYLTRSEAACDAAAALADRARKTLGAGLDGEQIRQLWPSLELPAIDRSGRSASAASDQQSASVSSSEQRDAGRRQPAGDGIVAAMMPADFEAREAQAAYDDEWIGRQS